MSDNSVIFDFIKKIKSLASFEPSNEVNKIFSDLVNYALTTKDNINISREDFEYIQKSAALAEYELEKYWVRQLLDNNKKLEDFVYYDNYIKLTRIEWSSLLACKLHRNHNVLFVGSGPLPLTGLILARDYGCHVTLMDISDEAVELSKKLVSKLELTGKINVVNFDALSFDKYLNFDVIYLAALAGISKGLKKKILNKIKTDSSEKVHLIARSSFGNREILYKPLTDNDIDGFKIDLEVKPHNDVVNSFLILSK